MRGPGRVEVVDAFSEAGQAFVALVRTVPAGAWGQPGLGEWNVRQLVGHAGRAFATVVEYLAPEGPAAVDAAAGGSESIAADSDPIGDAGAYFLSTVDNPRLSAQVAERGRAAGVELGDDPASTVASLVQAALEAVRTAPETAVFVTRFGVVGFTTYLCTRVVEAVVHSIDIARACSLDLSLPAEAERLALSVIAESARRSGHGPRVISALGGRTSLPEGFSLFG